MKEQLFNKDVNTYYRCALCNTAHETIEARNDCETKCLKKQKLEEETRKRNEEMEQCNNSKKEIEEILDKADKMIQAHLSKYSSLSLTRNYYYLSYLFKKLSLWF